MRQTQTRTTIFPTHASATGGPFADRAMAIRIEVGRLPYADHAQTAGVEQVDNQSGRVAVSVKDLGEQPEHLFLGGAVPGVSLLLGAEGINWLEFLLEDFPVEEQECVEAWLCVEAEPPPVASSVRRSWQLLLTL